MACVVKVKLGPLVKGLLAARK